MLKDMWSNFCLNHGGCLERVVGSGGGSRYGTAQ